MLGNHCWDIIEPQTSEIVHYWYFTGHTRGLPITAQFCSPYLLHLLISKLNSKIRDRITFSAFETAKNVSGKNLASDCCLTIGLFDNLSGRKTLGIAGVNTLSVWKVFCPSIWYRANKMIMFVSHCVARKRYSRLRCGHFVTALNKTSGHGSNDWS